MELYSAWKNSLHSNWRSRSRCLGRRCLFLLTFLIYLLGTTSPLLVLHEVVCLPSRKDDQRFLGRCVLHDLGHHFFHNICNNFCCVKQYVLQHIYCFMSVRLVP